MQLLSKRRELGQAGMRRAAVSESPLANSVTSCPNSTSSSVRYDTTRSVPPYFNGGTLSHKRATSAIFTLLLLTERLFLLYDIRPNLLSTVGMVYPVNLVGAFTSASIMEPVSRQL